MGKRILSLCMALVLCVFILPFPILAEGQDDASAVLQAASDRGDNYPYADKVYGRYWQPDDVDPWNFFYRECTSFVAWCLNSRNGVAFHNTMGGRRWGNAMDWGATAKALGYAVDNSPAVGSVAWSNAGYYGHVAWVSAVNGGNVTIEEYNYSYSNPGRFGTRTVATSSFTGFIHIKDIIPTGPLDLGNSFSAFVYSPSLGRYVTNDGTNITSRIRTGTPKQLWNFQKNDNGSYKITSAADGKSWDVVYSGTSSGTNVQSIPYTGVGAQQWDIYGSEGAYYFSARCTNCVLDIAGGSSDDGANIQMYAYNGSGAQLFSIEKAQFNNVTDMGSDFYAYIILNESWTHFENRDRNVQLVRDNNDSLDPRQIWHFIKKDDGTYQIVSEYDGRCLDANNFGNTNGTNISVVASNDSSAQRWFIITCDDKCFLMPSYCDLVLDANDGLSHGHGSNAQLWAFVKSGNQFLSIYNVENDKPGIDYKNEKPSAPQAPSISIDSGTTPVQISWTTSPVISRYDNRTYSLDIFSGNSISENPVDSCTGLTVTSYEVTLPQGEYTVRVRANNTKYANLYSESTQTFAVTPTALTSLLIQSSPSKTVYKIGENLDTSGLSVVAKYSDGTDKVLQSGEYALNGFDSSSAGPKTITVSYGGQTVSFIVTVQPADSNAPQITVESKSALKGATVDIPVTIQKNPGISGAVMTVSYDKSVLTLSDITKGSVFETGTYTAYPETGVVSWYHTENVTEDGTLFTLQFEVNENASNGNYTIAVGVRDAIPANLSNAASEIVDAQFISGVLEIASGVCGDVTGDGVVAINDVVKVARAVAGNLTLTETEKTLADVTGDGVTAINDVVKLARYVAGNIASLQSAEAASLSDGESAVIEVATVSGAPGGSVRIPVSITSNPGIAGVQLNISFDEGLTLKNIVAGDVLSVGTFNPDISAGKVQWYYDQANVTNTGVLFTLEFEVNADAKIGDIYAIAVNVTDGITANLSDYDSNPVNAEFKPGEIQINETADNVVINTVSRNGNTVTANVVCSNGNASVFCGVYNNSGKMISVRSVQITSESNYQFQFDGQQFDYAKVFIVDSNFCPLCEAKRT